MSAPQTAPLIPFEIPVGGFNARDPLSRMDPLFSPYMINWETDGQNLAVRKGVQLAVDGTSDLIGPIRMSVSFGGDIYHVGNDSGGSAVWKNVNNSLSAVENMANNAQGWSYLKHGGATKKQLYIFTYNSDVDDTSAVYDGSTWTATWPFEYPVSTKQAGRCACSFKGRAYFFQGSDMYYSELSAISGTLNYLDMSSIVDDSDICWCGVISSPGQRADEQFLAFGTEDGGIYVYAGNYPGGSWQIIGRFKVAPIVGRYRQKPSLEINNDIWVMSEVGIVSLRKLFQNDSAVTDGYTISGAINHYWKKLISTMNFLTTGFSGSRGFPPYASLCYDENKSKVYIHVEGHLFPDTMTYASGGPYSINTLFSYDLNTESWSILHVPGTNVSNLTVGYLTYHNNAIYYTAYQNVMKYGPGNELSASFGDEEYRDEQWNDAGDYDPIVYELRGAYTNLGTANKNKDLQGWEPVINADFSATEVLMQSGVDMGRAESSDAYVTLQSGYQQPYYPIGAVGSYLQWRLKGSVNSGTASIGLSLYAMSGAVT